MTRVTLGTTSSSIGTNVKDSGAKGDGVTNDSSSILSAINALLALGGGELIFPSSSGSYVMNTQVSAILDANQSIELRGEGNATIRTDVEGALSFSGALKLTTTLEAQAIEGTRTLILASTAGLKQGDIISPTIPIIAETLYGREMTETHVIASVIDSTTVELGSPLEFRFYPQADLRWTGDGSRTAFWYPSYFVPQSQIQVLKDGVVQSTGFTIAVRSGDSNHNGFNITFTTAPANGVEVRIRNTQKIAVYVYRSGNLSIRNLRFSSTGGVNFIRMSGLLSPQTHSLHVESDTNTVLGDYLWFEDCVSPIVRNTSIKHGRYAIWPTRTRDADIEGVEAHDAWHPVSVASFSSNTNIRQVRGYRCQATVDAHPSFNTHMKDCFGYDDVTGIENRGAGGSMDNVHTRAKASSNAGFSNGILWTQDGDLEGPYTYRPYMVDFYISRSSFKAPNQTDGFYIYANQINHATFDSVVMDGYIGTGGSLANIGVNRMTLRDCDIIAVEPRVVNEELVIEGSSIDQLWMAGSGACPRVSVFGGTFSHPTAIVAFGDLWSGLGNRRFFGTRFHDATNFVDASGLGTGANKKRYIFVACTFDGIGAFDANIVANAGAYKFCDYINGTPAQTES